MKSKLGLAILLCVAACSLSMHADTVFSATLPTTISAVPGTTIALPVTVTNSGPDAILFNLSSYGLVSYDHSFGVNFDPASSFIVPGFSTVVGPTVDLTLPASTPLGFVGSFQLGGCFGLPGDPCMGGFVFYFPTDFYAAAALGYGPPGPPVTGYTQDGKMYVQFPTPEPTTFLLFASGTAVVGAVRRRFRR